MVEINEIVSVFSRIDDPAVMRKFFEEIFTSAERHDLALRWELMKRVREGAAQRKIATDLGISLCKITRGAKIVKDPESVTNKMLSKEPE